MPPPAAMAAPSSGFFVAQLLPGRHFRGSAGYIYMCTYIYTCMNVYACASACIVMNTHTYTCTHIGAGRVAPQTCRVGGGSVEVAAVGCERGRDGAVGRVGAGGALLAPSCSASGGTVFVWHCLIKIRRLRRYVNFSLAGEMRKCYNARAELDRRICVALRHREEDA